MKKPNQNDKNDSKEAESIKKGLRAECLFRYIEKKDKEFKQHRLFLLKSIVAKQREKIAYQSEKWEKKLKNREQKSLKIPKIKEKRVSQDTDPESRTGDLMNTKNDGVSSMISISLGDSRSSHHSLRGSRILSDHHSQRGSRILFDQSLRPGKQESMIFRNIPTLLELHEQKELQELKELHEQKEQTEQTEPQILINNKVVPAESPSKLKQSLVKKIQKPAEEASEAVSKIFKTHDAFLEFQSKYSRPIVESEMIKAEDVLKNYDLETRKEQIKRLHSNALKNRERIASYMAGESIYGMGVPVGFRVDPHAITDQIKAPSPKIEEPVEKVNLLEELSSSNTRKSFSIEKRASFSLMPGKPVKSASFKEEKDKDSQVFDKKAISLAQSQFEKSRRHTFHNRENTVLFENHRSNDNDILQGLATEINKEEKPKTNRRNSTRTSDLSFEEEYLLKSLAVMADDRNTLESSFLQKSLARSDIRQKSMLGYDEGMGLLDESPPSHSGSNSGLDLSGISDLNPGTKHWEHINLKSVEDFGSSMETSKTRLDQALKIIPNSFNQLCLKIELNQSKAKFGVFAASILPADNTKMMESKNNRLKIPKTLKYWKTSSSFDDDILTVK